jgi:hypothetical protein
MAEAAHSVKLTELSPIASGSTTSPSDVTDVKQRRRSSPEDAVVGKRLISQLRDVSKQDQLELSEIGTGAESCL